MRPILSYLCFFHGFIFTACSAPVMSMKCQELRFRLQKADSEDQKRFAAIELENCEKDQNQAKKADSTVFEGIQRRFTPAEDSL